MQPPVQSVDGLIRQGSDLGPRSTTAPAPPLSWLDRLEQSRSRVQQPGEPAADAIRHTQPTYAADMRRRIRSILVRAFDLAIFHVAINGNPASAVPSVPVPRHKKQPVPAQDL